MLQHVVSGPWGTDKIPDGVRINVQSSEEEIYSFIFSGEFHLKVAKEIVEKLTPAQKRDLIPLVTSGIEVPRNFEPGPQG